MPKDVDHNEMRLLIINGAFELFRNAGHQALSMREISKGLGVTTGVLYHYFSDKKELMNAVLKQKLSDSILGVDKIHFFKPRKSGDLSSTLREAISRLGEDEETALTTVMLLSDFFRSFPTSSERKKHSAAAEVFLDAFVEALGLKAKDRELAATLLTYVVGLLVVRLWTDSEIKIQDQAKEMLRLLAADKNRTP